jgi:virginiamycin A acetyltransferase
VIQELENIAWWDWTIEKITANLEAIAGANLDVLKKLDFPKQ